MRLRLRWALGTWCGGCAEAQLHATAGLRFVGRCDARQYGFYEGPCGHRWRRQFGFVERIARGEVAVRCETCLNDRYALEAAELGWTLVGAGPDRNASYRLYRHKACGHEQRHARVNKDWGQIDCASCGTIWAAHSSYIYLLSITVPQAGLRILKLGHSKHSQKRFRHQL